MHEIIRAALSRLGIALDVASADRPDRSYLCFQHVTAGDLTIGNCKVVGSAQRRQRGALLQHGSILLEHSAHCPCLAGIADLTGTRLTPDDIAVAITDLFSEQTGASLIPSNWSGAEQAQINRLASEKYQRDCWNLKR
jgi:lipoate-protein ligase A